MRDGMKSLRELLVDCLGVLVAQFRASLFTGNSEDVDTREGGGSLGPDFNGWLHNDPMITGNPADRYGDDAPGYLTGNGLGSLEIGAADD